MAAALPAADAAPIITLPGVFKGRELTRKDRRLSACLEPVNTLLEGGIPRGRISEIVGRRGCGKTSLAAAFISSATRRSEVAAVIDLANAFDPATMAEAGIELSKVLWIHPGCGVAPLKGSRFFRWYEEYADNGFEEVKGILEERRPHPGPLPGQGEGIKSGPRQTKNFLRAAELVLEAGGFGLLVMDFGESAFTLPQSAALRLARMAERSGTAVLMLAIRPVCGTFAALSLDLASTRSIFSRNRFGKFGRWEPERKLNHWLKSDRHPHPNPLPGQGEGTAPRFGQAPEKNLPRLNVGERNKREFTAAPALFEGIEIKASVRRNKIGRSGLSAQWRSLVNPSDLTSPTQASKAARIA